MAIRTLNELFLTAARRDQASCLRHRVDGAYRTISMAELVADVRRAAAALAGFGLRPGDRIALMAENGPHWPTIDFAVLGLGGVLAPIYPTLTAEQAAYIVQDCGAETVFVQGAERLQGLLGVRSSMPGVQRFVLIGDGERPSEVPTLADLLATTEPMAAAEFERRASAIRPGDLATLIYTSGTTGQPKGVMLSHGNLASNIEASLTCLEFRADITALSFLPLSHSFERAVDYMYFLRGVTIAYAESVQTVGRDLLEARPHVLVSVPRVYEKLLARIRESVAASPPLRRRIFAWAETVGRAALPWRLRRGAPPGWLGLRLKLADALVFAKIRARLGGRFEFAVSGGAPLPRDVAEFFWAAGIEIYEGYGLTETSPVLTINRRSATRLGTVGPAIPGVELAIAADGEILARGPNIMQGYFNLPRATAEVIDENGWFHTGDIGALDADGFLYITDRKKELIVNAYGKNIAPAPIENQLKASRFIEQAVLIGDRRQFLSALLVPDFEALGGWAASQGLATADRAALLAEPAVRELLGAEVAAINRSLARFEQVVHFDLLPAELTIQGGELTPTMKVKRRVVAQKYADLIEGLYRGDAEGD